jgi:hypothetical protein
MLNDKKLFIFLLILLAIPISLAFLGSDRFRYPCQDPENWDKPMCKLPICDVTRTCPEHIFKGQRDPRLGASSTKSETPVTNGVQCPPPVQGANSGK